jgi:hypothetical protein
VLLPLVLFHEHRRHDDSAIRADFLSDYGVENDGRCIAVAERIHYEEKKCGATLNSRIEYGFGDFFGVIHFIMNNRFVGGSAFVVWAVLAVAGIICVPFSALAHDNTVFVVLGSGVGVTVLSMFMMCCNFCVEEARRSAERERIARETATHISLLPYMYVPPAAVPAAPADECKAVFVSLPDGDGAVAIPVVTSA